jgi:hypothetical protein
MHRGEWWRMNGERRREEEAGEQERERERHNGLIVLIVLILPISFIVLIVRIVHIVVIVFIVVIILIVLIVHIVLIIVIVLAVSNLAIKRRKTNTRSSWHTGRVKTGRKVVGDAFERPAGRHNARWRLRTVGTMSIRIKSCIRTRRFRVESEVHSSRTSSIIDSLHQTPAGEWYPGYGPV